MTILQDIENQKDKQNFYSQFEVTKMYSKKRNYDLNLLEKIWSIVKKVNHL